MTEPCSFHIFLLAAQDTERATATNTLIIMFLLILGLLALFFVVVILNGISNRRNAAKKAKDKSADIIDAWQAAGERAETFDEPEDI